MFRSSFFAQPRTVADGFDHQPYVYDDSPINTSLYDRCTAASSATGSRKASSVADCQYDWYVSPPGAHNFVSDNDDGDNLYYYGGTTYSSSSHSSSLCSGGSCISSVPEYDFVGNVDSAHAGKHNHRKHREEKEKGPRWKPLRRPAAPDDPPRPKKPTRKAGDAPSEGVHKREKSGASKSDKTAPDGPLWKPLPKLRNSKSEVRQEQPAKPVTKEPSRHDAPFWKPLTKPELSRTAKGSASPKPVDHSSDKPRTGSRSGKPVTTLTNKELVLPKERATKASSSSGPSIGDTSGNTASRPQSRPKRRVTVSDPNLASPTAPAPSGTERPKSAGPRNGRSRSGEKTKHRTEKQEPSASPSRHRKRPQSGQRATAEGAEKEARAAYGSPTTPKGPSKGIRVRRNTTPATAADVAEMLQFSSTPVQRHTGNSVNNNSMMASARAAELLPKQSNDNNVDDAFPRHSVFSLPEQAMQFANMNGKSFRRLTSTNSNTPNRLERQDELPPRKWAYVSHFASEYRKAVIKTEIDPSVVADGGPLDLSAAQPSIVPSAFRSPLDRQSLFNSQRTTRSAVSPASTVVDEVIDDDGRVLHAPTTSFLWHTGNMSWKSAMPMPDESSGPPAENLTPASVASDGEPPESMRFPTMPSEHKRRQTVVTVLSAQSETVGRIFPPLEQRRQSAPLPPFNNNVPMPPVRHTQAQVVQPTRPVYAPPPPMSLHPHSKPAPAQSAVAAPPAAAQSTVFLSPPSQPQPLLQLQMTALDKAMREFVPKYAAPHPQPKYNGRPDRVPHLTLQQWEQFFGYRLKDIPFVDSPRDQSLVVADTKQGRRRQRV